MPAQPVRSDWLRARRGRPPAPAGRHVVRRRAPSDDPLAFVTIAAAARRDGAAATARASRGVLRAENRGLSLARPSARADDVAAGLLALGLRPRRPRRHLGAELRRVAARRSSRTARIGAILVNINPAYRTCRARVRAEQGRAAARWSWRARFKSSDYLGDARDHSRRSSTSRAPSEALDSCRLPKLKHVVLIGDEPRAPACLSFSELRALAGPAQRGRLDALSAALDPDDAINIQFTSGTTGAPKGATLSHFNIVNNARYCAQGDGADAATTGCASRCRCTTASAWCSACCAARPSGATMVFPGEGFDAERHAACAASATLHRAARRADDVHRDARSPALRATSTSSRCAPASWPARPARSRRCAAWSRRCTCAR